MRPQHAHLLQVSTRSLITLVATICQNAFSQKYLCMTSQAKSLQNHQIFQPPFKGWSCALCHVWKPKKLALLHSSPSVRSWILFYFVSPENTIWAFRCSRSAVISEGTGLCSAVPGDLCSHLSESLWCSLLSFESPNVSESSLRN